MMDAVVTWDNAFQEQTSTVRGREKLPIRAR